MTSSPRLTSSDADPMMTAMRHSPPKWQRLDQMARQRRVDCDMGGLGVADFADHDHIRVLTNKGAHRRRKGQPDRRLDLRLVDAGNFIFDRIFDGEDFPRQESNYRGHCNSH